MYQLDLRSLLYYIAIIQGSAYLVVQLYHQSAGSVRAAHVLAQSVLLLCTLVRDPPPLPADMSVPGEEETGGEEETIPGEWGEASLGQLCVYV